MKRLKLTAMDMRYPLALSAAVLAICGVMLIADGWRASAEPPRPAAPRLRDYSEAALQREIGAFDPAMAALARRFDPLGVGRAAPMSFRQEPTSPVEAFAVDDLAPMPPSEAFRVNALVPISTQANPAAKPFVLDTTSAAGTRALDCLTAAVYYEAAYESPSGQAAVAQVVLNRMRHPAYPKSICGVVLQGADRRSGCQFTFTCDGALGRAPNPLAWTRSRAVAAAALNGRVEKTVGHATHYHTVWVRPYWSSSLTKVRVIGAHIFYRWNGGWGLARSFRGQYAGELDEYLGLRALYTALRPLNLKGATPDLETPMIAIAARTSGLTLAVDNPNSNASGSTPVAFIKTVDAPTLPPAPPKLIHIAGEVEKPGDYPWREGMTLADAAKAAGGFTYRAKTKVAYLRRAGDTVESKVDATALALQPNDQVRVPERFF